MRVLQVDSGREWRGGQNQVWLLCRELARHPDVEETLVTRQESELARRATAAGVPVQGTAWEIGLDPRAWWLLRRTIAAFQPDVIHVHDSHALTLAATVAMGRKLVATRRVDFHVGRFGAWRRPDRIIAVSAAVKDVLTRDGIASDAIVVVPDGVDPDDRDRRRQGVWIVGRRREVGPAFEHRRRLVDAEPALAGALPGGADAHRGRGPPVLRGPVRRRRPGRQVEGPDLRRNTCGHRPS